MTTIVTRTGKGSPLTHVEVDTNFTNLNTNKLEAGAIALGSAATPSISFTGDTNTGIYSPGADQVAVATNGTQRLNIGSTGHIANSRSIATAFSGANAATWTNGLTLANAATPGAGVSNLIVFEGTSNVNAVFGVTQAGSTYGDFVWAAYNGSFSETMRLTSAGLLGIGTSAPASALDVSGGSIKLRNASSGTNYGYEVDINHVSGVSQKMLTARYMIAGASGSYTEIAGINAEIENADTNVYGMSFRTGGSLTEHVRIDGSGRLLVGTTSHSGANLLQVNSDALINGITVGRGLASISTNTAVGSGALSDNTTGSNNTANGFQALYFNTTGSSNTAIGSAAGYAINTGAGNISIGGLTSTGATSPVFATGSENNRISMGSTAVTNAYIQVAWTVVSDARDKTNFAPVPHGLDFVNALKPTAFQFKLDRESDQANGPVRYGFKAQDILELEGENSIIIDSVNPDKLYYNGESLIPVLVNAIKELSAKNTALEARLTAAGID